MPVMDGLALCRQLRAEAATQRVAVVAVTGAADQAQAALAASCDAVLAKPCSRALLLTTIQLLIDHRDSRVPFCTRAARLQVSCSPRSS